MCYQHILFFIPAILGLLTFLLLVVFRLRYYHRLSETDELTSLPNYRGLRKKLAKVIPKYKKQGKPLCLTILDIDRFKQFNDHSYALGDRVLIDFVKFLRIELPNDAFIARFRLGDEFIMLLPYNAEEATEKMKAILNKSKNLIYQRDVEQMQYSLSFSFGIAALDLDNDSGETLLEKAERSLKENKKLKSD
jgi:diguanylate cyclase (GGDEF)-like protein